MCVVVCGRARQKTYSNVWNLLCCPHPVPFVSRVLQCIAVCCSALQCVAVCCSVLQCQVDCPICKFVYMCAYMGICACMCLYVTTGSHLNFQCSQSQEPYTNEALFEKSSAKIIHFWKRALYKQGTCLKRATCLAGCSLGDTALSLYVYAFASPRHSLAYT